MNFNFGFTLYTLDFMFYSYRKISTGFVLAAIIAGITVPMIAAIIANNTIGKTAHQSTLLGILLNIYTLLFQSFKPKIILIHPSIVLIFFVMMYAKITPSPEPIVPT